MLKEAMFYERLEGGSVICNLCRHHCKVLPDKKGICGVRINKEGRLYTEVYGKIIASHIDPIEKKPLYHFFPGSYAYSIATIGCNFRCSFCQNWEISQASRDSDVEGFYASEKTIDPEEIVRSAKRAGCKSISYTYTEPTIFFEYAYDCARLAKELGLYNNFVTNGYIAYEPLRLISPYLDACNVDLKSFSDDFYKRICGARLKPVLDSIADMKRLGIWVEITTLVIPDENDSEDELKSIAEFIASIDKDMPWHISRFHPDYKYLNSRPTSLETLKMAMSIGKDAGLRYIYLGNVLEGGDTYCYNCNSLLVKRALFEVIENNIVEGKCRFCKTTIKGIF